MAVFSSAAAVDLPPGYTQTVLLTELEINSPTKLAFAPDGALWIASSDYKIHLLDGGTLYTAVTLPFSGIANGERTIQGLEIDPDYDQNQRVWVHYTHAGPTDVRNRLSHFTRSGNLLINEVVVYESPPMVSPKHNGGCLIFAEDKTLYMGIGDDSMTATTSQNNFEERGSVLHMNRDGTPAANNPYLDGVAGSPYVFTKGARNPFSCSLQPSTDTLWIVDVGAGHFEEINLAYPGANHGWPTCEGPIPAGQPYTYAWHDYAHVGGFGAIMAGEFIEAGQFNPAFEGKYIYADHVLEQIRVLEFDNDLNIVSDDIWATNTGTLIDLDFGPDGDLYYSCIFCPDAVGKISWVGAPNLRPSARGVASPIGGVAPLNVTLDATLSSDPDNDPLTYDWDLGDGGNDSGVSVNNVYPAGVYEAFVTVDDGQGESDVSMPIRIVSGNEAPTGTLTAPLPGSNYNAGAAVNYSGTGSDPELGSLWCARFSWQILFHTGNDTYPVYGPNYGDCSSSFVPSTEGITDPNAWYEIRMTVRDSGNSLGAEAELTDTKTVSIFPNLAELTFETLPFTDLDLSLDGTTFTAPDSFDSVVGMTRTLGAPDRQLRGDGHRYSLISWSDGLGKEHPISTPGTPTTYTATFGCDVLIEAANLEVAQSTTPGDLELSWDPVNGDPCQTSVVGDKYRIYAAISARPTGDPVDFPSNPDFVLIGSTDVETFSYTPAPEHLYFVVAAVGTDNLAGFLGHYGR